MILAVLASDNQKREIAESVFFKQHEVVFSENNSLWAHHNADAYLDLGFEPTEEKISSLARLLSKPVMVNAVIPTIDEIHPGFIRVNGWPGFLKGKYLEAAAKEETKQKAINLFGDQLKFVNDIPGLFSPRIVAMIINEAFFTWEAGTATKEDIDIAMKLGTGYPYGPFEWALLIGEEKVAKLLIRLASENSIYELAQAFRQPSTVNR
jgi:3-hydroxybutyryl-CoA dehydrogenase